MRSAVLSSAVIGSLLLSACGGDGNTEPNPTYHSIAGSYAGEMAGISQGVTMNADFTLTVNQTQGNLSGTYAMVGTLCEPGTVVDVAGTGVISGTVATGDNPNLSVSFEPAHCPSQTAQFSGAYDSTNRRITINGPVRIFNDACVVVLTYPMTIVLTR